MLRWEGKKEGVVNERTADVRSLATIYINSKLGDYNF